MSERPGWDAYFMDFARLAERRSTCLRRRVGAVVVTRGEKGSRILKQDGVREVAPVQAEAVVDPTGCGDAYRAGLLYGRLQGMELHDACRVGSLMGSLKVAVEGPQGLDLEPGTVAERYAAEFGAPLA